MEMIFHLEQPRVGYKPKKGFDIIIDHSLLQLIRKKKKPTSLIHFF